MYFNVNFNMFFKIKKCVCWWVKSTYILPLYNKRCSETNVVRRRLLYSCVLTIQSHVYLYYTLKTWQFSWKVNNNFFLIFVVPSIMLYSSEITPTRCNNCIFILRNGFTLHVSGDNLTHHQEYICCIWPQVSRLT